MPFIRNTSIITAAVRLADATGQHTIDLARILRKRNIEVDILCNSSTELTPEDLRPITKNISPQSFLPEADLTFLQYPIWYPLAERFRYTKKASIFWYHGVTPPALWGNKEGVELLQLSQRNSDLAWYGDLAVCASPFTANELHSHSAYPKERLRIVPYAIDTSHLTHKTPRKDLDTLRERFNLRGKTVLLYVGRIAGHKRIDILIDALSMLATAHPDLSLLIVGNHKGNETAVGLTQQLCEQATRLGIADRVVFAGEALNVAPYYELAHLFLQASQHEGFCVPLIEAMAVGVPIVASNNGAMPWVLNAVGNNNNAAGLIFESGSPHSLAQQIKNLLDHDALRSQLVECGEQRMREFDYDHFEKRVMDLIGEAVEYSKTKLIEPQSHPLHLSADVMLRDYRVRSRIPFWGRIVEKIRMNSTSHLKEAYIDRVLERQVQHNLRLADELRRLHSEVARLHTQLKSLQKQQSRGKANDVQ